MVLIIFVCTIIAVFIGIAGIVMAATAIGKMEESEAEEEAVRIIIKGLK